MTSCRDFGLFSAFFLVSRGLWKVLRLKISGALGVDERLSISIPSATAPIFHSDCQPLTMCRLACGFPNTRGHSLTENLCSNLYFTLHYETSNGFVFDMFLQSIMPWALLDHFLYHRAKIAIWKETSVIIWSTCKI